MKYVKILAITLASLLLVITIWCSVSYWPAAMLLRWVFNKEAIKTNEALLPLVPPTVKSTTNLVYTTAFPESKLTIHYPEKYSANAATVVWIHGGGFLSGSKEQVENYCKILSGKGFVVAAIDYLVGPEHHYPTPILQTMAALEYLIKNAEKLGINKQKLVLAGDSGGAHITAQVALAAYDTAYAATIPLVHTVDSSQLKAVVLHCGPHHVKNLPLSGVKGYLFNTFLWSYSGSRQATVEPSFESASVYHAVGNQFPKTLLTVGNADPLAGESSVQMSQKLIQLNVPTTTVLFDKSYEPKLPHEFQFNFTFKESQLVLEKTVEFLEQL
ncbi:MAG: alpha/beta hydrolase [Bacteroidetes bacterium]|nr:MAG: alpha/beta hydrolase [Bacteroidota bacterium]